MAPRLISARRRHQNTPRPRLSPAAGSTRTHSDTYIDLRVAALLDHDRRTVVRDYRFGADEASVTLMTNKDPAARWALARLLAGRLAHDRYTFYGHVRVAGHRSRMSLRSLVALAEPWHVRSVDNELQRRLRALDWAEATDSPVVVLSPGLDGLDPRHFSPLLDHAHRLSDKGVSVIITAPLDVDLHVPHTASGALGNIAVE